MRDYVNPTFYSHVLHAGACVVGAARVLVGREPSFREYAARETVDPHWLILCGRALSCAASVGTVVALAAVGARLFSPLVGLVAALALAVDRLATLRATLVGNESLMCLLVVLALLVRVGELHRPSTRRLACAAFLAGLAISTKYSAGCFLVPLLLFRGVSAARVGAVLVGALAGFLAGSPSLPFHLGDFRRDFAMQHAFLESGYVENDAVRRQSGYAYYVASFAHQHLGFAFAVACALGLCWSAWRALRRRDVRDGLLLAAVLPLYLFLGRGIFHYARFLMPAVPFVLLAGAVAVERATCAAFARKRAGSIGSSEPRAAAFVIALVAIALVAPGAFATWNDVTRRARREDPRAEVLVWARTLVPAGERCGELALGEAYALFRRTVLENGPRTIDPALDALRARHRERIAAADWWRDTTPLESLLEDTPALAELRSRLARRRIALLIVDLPAVIARQPRWLPQRTGIPAFRSWPEWTAFYEWIAGRPCLGRRSWESREGGPTETALVDLHD